MDVTLTDRSQVSVSHTCLVPLVVCAYVPLVVRGRAFHCVVECHILPEFNHNIVLGIDWLQAANPVIDWKACTMCV